MSLCGQCQHLLGISDVWTPCSKCDRKFHNKCAGLLLGLAPGETFVCEKFCREIAGGGDGSDDDDDALKKLEKRQKELAEAKTRAEKQLKIAEMKKQIEQCERELEMLHISGQNPNDPPTPVLTGNLETLMAQQIQILNQQNVKELPRFDGECLDDWPIFYGLFLKSTRDGRIDGPTNMDRLTRALAGGAKRTVAGALTMPDNVDEVMNLLKKKYGRLDVIVKRKLLELKDLPQPRDDRPQSVIRFYEFISTMKYTIASAGGQNYLDGPQMLDEIVDKLPLDAQRGWMRHKLGREAVNLNTFLEWYEVSYELALEQNVRNQVTRKQMVGSHEEIKFNSKRCSFCKRENHLLDECKKFSSRQFPLRNRYDFLRKNRLCFNCLLERHYTKDCGRNKCGVNGCKETHHPVLHKEFRNDGNSGNSGNQRQMNQQSGDQNNGGSTHAHQFDSVQTHFRLVPVKLSNGEKSHLTWAFLDEGSGPTLLAANVANLLGVTGSPKELCLKWTDGSVKKNVSEIVSIQVCGADGGRKFTLNNVKTVPNLELPIPQIDLPALKKQYKHLADVNIPNIPSKIPEILIGLEHVKLMIPYQVREGSWSEPIATQTRIGWAIYGGGQKNDSGATHSVCQVCECETVETEIRDLVRSFHTTESFGVEIPKDKLKSKEEEIANSTLEKTAKLENGRYEIGLLWKSPDVVLPDNRTMAFRRLACFEQKLKKDPVLKSAVLEKVTSHIEKGYWEKVSEKEVKNFNGRKWFLPVFSVQNPNKPNKVRLVQDAAAKFQGVSLNDVLLSGPDNLTPLLGVLLRFREGKIGICGDIAEMYHRVRMKPEDQFSQLILWRDLDESKPPDVYKMTVMSFGATCSPSAAQYVKNLNACRFADQFPRAVDAILNRHYVDDFLDAVNSPEEALKLAQEVSYIHSQGGFQIRNWISNSPDVVEQLDPDKKEVRKLEVSLDIGEGDSPEKVLGMNWDTKTDNFTFKLCLAKADPEVIAKKKIPTKREVLRIVMSLFDPLGIIATIVMPAKILLQDLWRTKCDWDQKIPPELQSAWKNWLDSLSAVEAVKVPRWYSPFLLEPVDIQLHLMADASELAFATVAYLRIATNNDVSLSFVASKTRVAPQKALSIPRLELQAAVLASRLASTLREELTIRINRIVYWSDSQTTLGWIRSSHRKYSSFVSHRVGGILEKSDVRDWRWVPSKENVADEATKWREQPAISERWLLGPGFLKFPEEKWPVEREKVTSTKEEEKSQQFHLVHQQVVPEVPIIDVSRFSNWTRLLRATAFALRYVKKLKKAVKDRKEKKNLRSRGRVEAEEKKKLNFKSQKDRSEYLKEKLKELTELNGNELESAQRLLIRKCQHESFPSELQNLKNSKDISKKSPIYNLGPILDENGILRIQTRLDAAPAIVNPKLRRPILLDGNHRISCLIIMSIHKKFHHQFRETVVNEIRQWLWIPKIRVHVNRVVRQCTLCSYLKAKPRIPRMANLPLERLAPFTRPFAYTGIDYMGPFEVTIGRRREKRWVALFTCLTMRAIHLEVACSLDTSSCVMCIRNFINRRGYPIEIMSDNGTNLRSAEKELKLLLKDVDFDQVMAQTQPNHPSAQQIQWKNITPVSPHFGGAWERMVRTVKNGMYQVLKSKAPREETFRAVVIEVEGTVNSRPLNYSSTDDINQPAISPNTLLQQSNCVSLPQNPENFDCRKQWVVSQQLAHEFWKRWSLEYLPTIASRSKWFDETKPLKEGQVVLIMDQDLRRGEWKKAIVIKTHASSDGKIRTATVKTDKGVYLRPVAKLAVIDCEKTIL